MEAYRYLSSIKKKYGKIYIYRKYVLFKKLFIFITLVRIYMYCAFLILYSYYLGD